MIMFNISVNIVLKSRTRFVSLMGKSVHYYSEHLCSKVITEKVVSRELVIAVITVIKSQNLNIMKKIFTK
jgi:hypothetical protein